MDIRGKGVDFNTVSEIMDSATSHNIGVHPDAKALGQNDYGFRGRIHALSSDGPQARKSWQGRRTRAACWHAYRDAVRAVFAVYPHAVITTALARYEGSEGFEAVYPATADHNIGSMMQPAYMPDLCNCDDWEG